MTDSGGWIKEEPMVSRNPAMFRTTYRLGSHRPVIDESIYRLVWAQQFKPLRVNGTTMYCSYCAYGGLTWPLRVEFETGFAKPRSGGDGNLDHRVPVSKGGSHHPLNLQYLSAFYNGVAFKGGKPSFHARWEAFRQGGYIDDLPFEPLAEEFLYIFDKFGELIYAWPWWAREKEKPFRPILFGFDEGKKEMAVSAADSYAMELAVLARNVANYCATVGDKKLASEVKDTFCEVYGTRL